MIYTAQRERLLLLHLNSNRMGYNSPDDPKIYCCYCSRWLVFPLTQTIEHLIPKSQGGNNSINNIRPCCSRCNHWRNDKPLEIWKREIVQELKKKYIRRPYNEYDLIKMINNIEYYQCYIAYTLRNNPGNILKTNT